MFEEGDIILAPFYWSTEQELLGRRKAMVVYADEQDHYLSVYWLDIEVVNYLRSKENLTHSWNIHEDMGLKDCVLANGRDYLPDEGNIAVQVISKMINNELKGKNKKKGRYEENYDPGELLEPEDLEENGHVIAAPPRARDRLEQLYAGLRPHVAVGLAGAAPAPPPPPPPHASAGPRSMANGSLL